jgi:hypothetical protein
MPKKHRTDSSVVRKHYVIKINDQSNKDKCSSPTFVLPRSTKPILELSNPDESKRANHA